MNIIGRAAAKCGPGSLDRSVCDNRAVGGSEVSRSPLEALLEFPLMEALFGRRARRFGLGMEIPSGPLAFRSEKAPLPLSELEQMTLVAAATGVSGWSFGVPFTPGRRTPTRS